MRQCTGISSQSCFHLFIALLIWANAWGQGTSGERFRVKSELALLDLIAQNSSRESVNDLSPEQIELMVDGEERKIDFFQLINLESSSEGDVSPPGSRLPVKPAPMILVFDLNSMASDQTERTQVALRSFLSSQSVGNATYMLVSIGNQLDILSELTPDPGEIVSALPHLGMPRSRLSYVDLVERVARIFRTLRGLYPTQAADQSIYEGKTFLREVHNRIQSTCDALAKLADLVSQLPGRKSIVFFSGGYPLNSGTTVYEIMREFNQGILPAHILSAKLEFALSSDQSDDIQTALDRLNAASAAVYVVDSRGLSMRSLINSPEANSIPHAVLTGRNSEDMVAPLQFLRTFAQDTGGLFFSSSNDLLEGLSVIQSENLHYYLVGYVPETKNRKEETSNIQVRSSRQDLSLRYRKTVSFEPPQERDGEDPDLLAAFQFPRYYSDFPIESTESLEGRTLKVSVRIPSEDLIFAVDDGKHRCTLELYGGLFDSNGSWVSFGKKFAFARQFNLEFDDVKLTAFRQNRTVTGTAQAELKPGTYRLAVVVRQLPSRRLATSMTDIQVK